MSPNAIIQLNRSMEPAAAHGHSVEDLLTLAGARASVSDDLPVLGGSPIYQVVINTTWLRISAPSNSMTR